jgi:hypothetical protein
MNNYLHAAIRKKKIYIYKIMIMEITEQKKKNDSTKLFIHPKNQLEIKKKIFEFNFQKHL